MENKQEEYYYKAMKSFIECGNDFQKLTPENKNRFISQLAQMCGVSEIIQALLNYK